MFMGAHARLRAAIKAILGLPWDCHDLPRKGCLESCPFWHCYGTGMNTPWGCHEDCHGTSWQFMALSWDLMASHHGIFMEFPWHLTAVPWQGHGSPTAVPVRCGFHPNISSVKATMKLQYHGNRPRERLHLSHVSWTCHTGARE